MSLSLATHHRVALVAATGLSGLALFDALTHGFTGHYSAFSDDSDSVLLQTLGSVVHGATYTLLVWALAREAGRIRAAGRVAAVFRWLLAIALGILAFGFGLLHPVSVALDVEDAVSVFGVIGGPAFLLMFVAGFGLGLSLLRAPEMRYGAALLTAIIPMFGLLGLLAWLAPDFAHPAYAETALHFGVALLGARAATATVMRPPAAAPVA